ncbi:MAG: carbohydrate binding family 9 domain-containing protein, partial [Terriglobales bacterium]
MATPRGLSALLAADVPDGMVAVEGFMQHDPREGVPVSQKTRVYLGYDDHAFYAVFHCRDTRPEEIRAHISRRDAILQDDYVGVALDTDLGHQRALLFEANARGQQQDGVLQQSVIDAQKNSVRYDIEAADYSFDTVWHSAATIRPDGYRVAIAIPFKSLRFPTRPVQDWGILLLRFIPRNGELSYWPTVTRSVNGLLTQEGRAESLSHLETPHNLQLVPYGLFRSDHVLDPNSGVYANHFLDQRAGLDAKYTFLTNFNLDLTANPDFSQVESDSPQETTNQRYEVYFPEKRPFFQERSDLFQTPGSLFFSRRILDPELGARLTGRKGRTTLGALWTDDRGPGEALPAGDPRAGARANFFAVRGQHDFWSDSSIGTEWTERDFLDRHNDVFSLDLHLRLSTALRLSAQAIQTLTRGHSAASEGMDYAPGISTTTAGAPWQSAAGYNASLNYASRTWEADASYNDLAPRFQADLGFIRRTNIRDFRAGVRRNFWGRRRFALAQPILTLRRNYDHRGVVEDETIGVGAFIVLAHDARLQLHQNHYFERYLGLPLQTNLSTVNIDSPAWDWLSAAATYWHGSQINYYPAAGLAPFTGAYQFGAISLIVRPTARLEVDNIYFGTRLHTRGPGGNIFNDHVVR